MKVIVNKSNASLAKSISKQDRKEAKGQSRDELEIVEVLVTDRVDAMSVKTSIAVSVRVRNVSDYHQVDFL